MRKYTQPPSPDLLVHSDHGGQYCGKGYRTLLHNHQALCSQSRRSDCYDNVQAESLWSHLKAEVLEGRERPVFADLADVQASVADYFDYFTSSYTSVLIIRRPITLTNSFFNLMP